MVYSFDGFYTDEQQEFFKEAQEVDLIKICDFLKTDPARLEQIKFHVFDTREKKQQADPNHSISRASARFDEMALYRVWVPQDDPRFPHEITHLVSHTWSKPYMLTEELDTAYGTKIKKTFEMVSTSFMQEGLAIAVDDIVFGRELLEEGEKKPIDWWCRQQISVMPKHLSQVINLDGFGSLPNKVIVPFTASFSKYLLKTYGMEKYKQMYVSLKETLSPEENASLLEKIFDKPEGILLADWKLNLSSKVFRGDGM